MADGLYNSGKEQGMIGIKNAIAQITLNTSGLALIDTQVITGTSFAVSAFDAATPGQLSNSVAIDFTIAAGDVGQTASLVRILSADGELIRIDLDTPVSLTTEGTATFAIGDLTAVL